MTQLVVTGLQEIKATKKRPVTEIIQRSFDIIFVISRCVLFHPLVKKRVSDSGILMCGCGTATPRLHHIE